MVNSRLDVMEFLLEFEADMEHETNSGYSVVELAFVMYHCFVEKFNGWNNNDPSVESVLGLPEKVTVTVAASAIAETTDTLVSTKSSPPKSAPAQAAATKTTPGEFRLDQMEQNVKGVMETYHSVQALKDVPINLPPHGFQRTGQQLYHLVSRYGLSMEKPMAENTFFLSWLKHWQHSVKEALLLLLNRGANWRRCIWPQPLLFSAVRGLDADLVQKLVDMGDDVNQRMFKEGFTVTPLLVACGQMGSAAVEVVEVLLKAGADPDVPEINTNPTKVQADKKGAKGKKGSPVPTSGPLDKGRRPIHVVFQRDGADPANEKLLEALIRYDATVDATWNNSSALASAVQLANVTMVDALLRVGCNVNRDLEGGKGNALCVLATLATTEGFLRCNKDAQTIKAVMKMLLASADFTIKIPLAEGPPGSPLDFASHLFAKQVLGANLPAQLEETLADLRTSITEAYKEATQLSVLRHRKLTLAGIISLQLQSLLRKYPQLIDGPDPFLKLKEEERAMLGAIKDMREKIGSLMEKDVSKEGQMLRPTLKIAYEEAVRTGVVSDGSTKHVNNSLDMLALARQVQSHLQVGGSTGKAGDDDDQRTAEDRRAASSKKQAAAAKAGQAMKQLSFAESQAFLPSQKEEWRFIQEVDSKGNIIGGASLVMGYSHGQVEVGQAGTCGQVTVLTQYQQGKKQGAFVGLKSAHVQHMVKATALLYPHAGPAAGKGKLRQSIIVHQPVYGKEGQGWQLKEGGQLDDAPSSQQLNKHSRHHHKVPRHDPDHPNLLVPAVHLLDDEGDALPLDHAVMEYRYCSQCGRSTGVGLSPCPRCNALFYDSKECQEAHWPLHRKRCAQIAQRKEHNEKVRKIVLEEKAQRRQKATPLSALRKAAPPPAGPFAHGHKRPQPPHAPSRKGQGPSRAHARGGLVKGSSSSRLRAARPSIMHRQATVKKAHRPLVASAGAPPQHLRSIDTACDKSQAEWMERVRQLNRLRMDDEMACFINDHYKWLVERGLNLAIARDVVEVKNGELYASMAFRRQIPLTQLIRYQQQTHQQLPEVTDTRLAHKEGFSSTMPLSPVTITSFPTTSTQHPARLSAVPATAASLSPAKDLTTFFTYQDSKDATFAFP
ncbi:hypothetical protein RvY_18890-1 [Ramazzottius varieornatus]|uniref:MYND-type domain-containing protein n=1 Tax=Ramazzottius varieornatus TaxID=947166 RepID=A0A1D1WBW2_RAMVA|nr:hypothetical protein RvY_18890-1 [Ramazzottius varieornatus]